MPALQIASDSQPAHRPPLREVVDRALAGELLTAQEAVALIDCDDLDLLLDAAGELRDRTKGRAGRP